jgi:protein-S-isoprenylcysteine O-methyltransferase Ste14
MKTENQKRFTKGTVCTVVFFYLLVAFEFFYMASPFAAYFYSVYKPGLSFINKYPSISWITGFFLPHLVESTNSPILNSIKISGTIIAALGLITFLICAGQVYYSKIFKKGMVNGGLYKYIRHPQYTAFAICSFGLLLLWPRFLVLIMFVTLLFAYYLLAKAEERECTAKYGESYLNYMRRTFMFLPVKIPFHFSDRVSMTVKAFIMLCLYVVLIFAAIKIGTLLKKSSIDSLYSRIDKKEMYVSIFELTGEQMDRLIETSNSDPLISELLHMISDKDIKLINYILPVDMYISEIPMIIQDSASCHVYNNKYDISKYKIVYSAAKMKDREDVQDGRDILFHTIALEPLAEVWIDINTKKVIKSVSIPAKTGRYKNIPEPVF